MSKYTTEQLLEAMMKHKNVSSYTEINNIMRIINGDLMFLQDAIINGDTILAKGCDGKTAFTGKPERYTVKPDYETTTHLGIEIPKPLTEYPDEGTEYYYKDGISKVGYSHWDNHILDKLRFKYGIWDSEKHAEIAIELINKVLEIKPI